METVLNGLYPENEVDDLREFIDLFGADIDLVLDLVSMALSGASIMELYQYASWWNA